jgi:hypothetical protein
MFKRAKISQVWNHFAVDSEQNKTAKLFNYSVCVCGCSPPES